VSETVYLMGPSPAMVKRPRQRNCLQEPSFPLHETVLFSMSSPNLTMHGDSKRCYTIYPHPIKECGEFREML
jgi:hypothetical protein